MIDVAEPTRGIAVVKARLDIWSDGDVDVARITESLAVEPDRAFRKGEARSDPSRAPYQSSVWELTTGYVDTTNAALCLDLLFSAFDVSAVESADWRNEVEVSVVVSWWWWVSLDTQETPVFILPAAQVAEVCRMKASLGLTQYIYGADEYDQWELTHAVGVELARDRLQSRRGRPRSL